MKPTTTQLRARVLALLTVLGGVAMSSSTARAAVPGIQGPSFALVASDGYTSQPDGASIYSWGYGCDPASPPTFVPFAGTCGAMQLPGPTLVVTEGQTVTVTLKNNLPPAA
jgi:FtsP/CotA-like multicopper oxidase with cupredoxin domain